MMTDPIVIRPPLGIMPRWRWLEIQNETRLIEIIDGVKRFHAGKKEIPEQWVDEYHSLIHAMNNNFFD